MLNYKDSLQINIRFLKYDIECGYKSHIRFCCIFWFITVWRFLKSKYRRKYILSSKDYGYIPCPICKKIKSRKVHRKNCIIEGIPDCKNDFCSKIKGKRI